VVIFAVRSENDAEIGSGTERRDDCLAQIGSLHLELFAKVLQCDGEVFRPSVPQSLELRHLFHNLDPDFEVSSPQCPILGRACRLNGSAVQLDPYLSYRK
jgi:hypothetical protein